MARTRAWKDPDKLQNAIDEYFTAKATEHRLPKWEDLLTALNITRNTWQLYISGSTPEEDKLYNTLSAGDKQRVCIDNKRAISDILKKTEQRFTVAVVEQVEDNPKFTPMGIFLLKQQHYGGYTDKQVAESSGTMALNVSVSGASGAAFEAPGSPDKTDK